MQSTLVYAKMNPRKFVKKSTVNSPRVKTPLERIQNQKIKATNLK